MLVDALLVIGALAYLGTFLLDMRQRRRHERRLADLEDRVFLGEVESLAMLAKDPAEVEKTRRVALEALRKGRSR